MYGEPKRAAGVRCDATDPGNGRTDGRTDGGCRGGASRRGARSTGLRRAVRRPRAQHRAGRPRQARPDPAGAGRAARRRPPADRGRARAWARRRSPRRSPASIDCAFRRIQFTPDLLPSDITGVNVFNQERGDFEFQPGADLRQRRARRRDQPRIAEDAVGAAGGHGGAPGDGRRETRTARRAVHGDRDPEPGRARGHVSAARGPARPVPDAARRSATPTATSRPRCSRRTAGPSRSTSSRRSATRGPSPQHDRVRAASSTSRRRSVRLHRRRSSRRPRAHPDLRLGASPRASICCCGPRGCGPRPPAATTSSPRT